MASSVSRTSTALLFWSVCTAISRRGNLASCISICCCTATIFSSDVLISNTCESMPCSACERRSAATNSALLAASAITHTSEGPAGISIATSCNDTCCLAAMTYWLPGPKILYTFGTDCVPYAIAPIACTPPILNTLSTPTTLAAARIAGFTLPSVIGGVQSTISLQPAILAGVASINTVEKSGAVPPGMYNPTRSIGNCFCQHTTPGDVSTLQAVID